MAQTSTLGELWDQMVKHGYDVKSKDKDGLAEWQPYKKLYGTYFLDNIDGIDIDNHIRYLCGKYYKPGGKDDEESVFEYDDLKLENVVDINHFFVQHCRIPKLMDYKVSVLKLLQIAYNAGQFKAERENKDSYDQKILDFYDDNDWININSFAKNIAHLIPKVKSTGGYYEKYINVKAEYLNLKKSTS
jgi:hypothetical protein